MNKKDLLIEIGFEELPAKSLYDIAELFYNNVIIELKKYNFKYQKIKWFATPRRIALKINNLSVFQTNSAGYYKGPSLKNALDENGNYTKIAKKWAKKNKFDIFKSKIIENKKGKWLFFYSKENLKHIKDLLALILEKSISNFLKFKLMKWDDTNLKFVRPIRNLCILLNTKPIYLKIFNINSSSILFSNYFLGAKKIIINNTKEYPDILLKSAKIIADYQLRKEKIKKGIQNAALEVNGFVNIHDFLLKEVTGLVECPKVLIGKFKKKFLLMPLEALVHTMEKNQKYFPIYKNQNNTSLLPFFIFISNTFNENNKKIIKENEKVLHARFSDIEYFFNIDCKIPLEKYLPSLKNVLFQKGLGNIYDQVNRIKILSIWISKKINANTFYIKRASLLSKCDLMTQMVSEFPEIKGIMGMYYASFQKEKKEICKILYEYYKPYNIKDSLPSTLESCVISIADKIDTIVGIISSKNFPKAKKDIFGLRRLSFSIIRIIIEKKLQINLKELIDKSVFIFNVFKNSEEISEKTFSFLMKQLKNFYIKNNFNVKIFQSVFNMKFKNLLNFHERIQLLSYFYTFSDFKNLILMYKRIKKILSKSEKEFNSEIISSFLKKKEEIILASTIHYLNQNINSFLKLDNFDNFLKEIRHLYKLVNQFFKNVLINTKNIALKKNRLTILKKLEEFFLSIADFKVFNN